MVTYSHQHNTLLNRALLSPFLLHPRTGSVRVRMSTAAVTQWPQDLGVVTGCGHCWTDASLAFRTQADHALQRYRGISLSCTHSSIHPPYTACHVGDAVVGRRTAVRLFGKATTARPLPMTPTRITRPRHCLASDNRMTSPKSPAGPRLPVPFLMRGPPTALSHERVFLVPTLSAPGVAVSARAPDPNPPAGLPGSGRLRGRHGWGGAAAVPRGGGLPPGHAGGGRMAGAGAFPVWSGSWNGCSSA